jgi:hypothetical protein
MGTARQELIQFEETDVCVEMTEDDFAALLCFPEVFRYVKSHRYENGQALCVLLSYILPVELVHIHLPL